MGTLGRVCPTITRSDGGPAIRMKGKNTRQLQYEQNRAAYTESMDSLVERSRNSRSRTRSNTNRSGSSSLSHAGSAALSGRQVCFRPASSPLASPYATSPIRKFKGRACSATIATHAKVGLWSSFTGAATPWQINPLVNEEDERAKRARALNMVGWK